MDAAMSVALRHANPAHVALVIGAATILGALASEVFGGLVPCELCLTQRLPYYFGIPLLLGSLLGPPGGARVVLRLSALAVFFWGIYLGIYHAGVEWKFWAGPTACSGTGSGFGFDALASLNDVRLVPCDQVQFRFLGLSLAGWNVLATLLISGLIGSSLRSGRKITVDAASEGGA
jgi:disulfide bond formation protein DsbB